MAASKIVPLHNPTVAETLTILAEAMAFRKLRAGRRTLAGPHPPSDAECGAMLGAYRGIEDLAARQAILDVLAAAGE